MTVVTTGEHTVDEGERRVERDLGAVANEIEHLATSVAEHTTTIEGLREDRNWITQRFEAIERDLAAIPKLPEETIATITSGIENLTHRLEQVEAALLEEDDNQQTSPPRRRDDERSHDNDTSENTSHEGNGRHRERRTILDHLF